MTEFLICCLPLYPVIYYIYISLLFYSKIYQKPCWILIKTRANLQNCVGELMLLGLVVQQVRPNEISLCVGQKRTYLMSVLVKEDI